METSDLTIEILKSIRDEVRATNTRLDRTNAQVEGLRSDMNARFGHVNARFGEVDARLEQLHQRQIETEIRLSTELVAVASAVREVRDELRMDRALRSQVDDHEHRIEALEKRTG